MHSVCEHPWGFRNSWAAGQRLQTTLPTGGPIPGKGLPGPQAFICKAYAAKARPAALTFAGTSYLTSPYISSEPGYS